jgi:hypothetical protein
MSPARSIALAFKVPSLDQHLDMLYNSLMFNSLIDALKPISHFSNDHRDLLPT